MKGYNGKTRIAGLLSLSDEVIMHDITWLYHLAMAILIATCQSQAFKWEAVEVPSKNHGRCHWWEWSKAWEAKCWSHWSCLGEERSSANCTQVKGGQQKIWEAQHRPCTNWMRVEKGLECYSRCRLHGSWGRWEVLVRPSAVCAWVKWVHQVYNCLLLCIKILGHLCFIWSLFKTEFGMPTRWWFETNPKIFEGQNLLIILFNWHLSMHLKAFF